MGTKILFTRRLLLLISLLIFLIGCQKEEPTVFEPHPISEPYIFYTINPQPCDDTYYVRMRFEDSESHFFISDPDVVSFPNGTTGLGIPGKGFTFQKHSTDPIFPDEGATIMFYISAPHPFSILTADYRYGDPWTGTSGANIEYFLADDEEPKWNSKGYHSYSGANVDNGHFKITGHNENTVCGTFKTILKSLGGDDKKAVEGEFCIPRPIYE
jgi:hypothetical protein